MSNETGAPTRSGDRTVREGALAVLDGIDPRSLAGGVALLSVGLLATLRVAKNAPVALPGFVADGYATVAFAGTAVPSLAAVGLAVASPDPRERVGLAFAGVFGLLGSLGLATTLPAAVAVVLGGAVAASAHVGRPRNYAELRPALVAVAVLAGVLASLAAGLGIAPGIRAEGTALAFLALAVTPALVRPGTAAWVLGGLAGATVVVAAANAPFVTGAVLLVAFGAVGTPALLLAAGVAGATTAFVGGARRGALPASLGVALLVAGGAPSTLSRAVVVVLGLALALSALDGPDAPGAPGGDPA